ncbi:hypothetical protein DL762_009786 [Monosporascus cannonballus]|uniref:Sulfurtransferase n=1 Tax=Monosporascus cannonballus TaxID=155416 RepID=A0ABY0GSD6_9PEZI|nr:hypothetical protein DL762_009786 [Monosporascus cannonballus]RYO77397.1 hypothetical protein DL763_009990 [Monosporascus cannonballus]
MVATRRIVVASPAAAAALRAPTRAIAAAPPRRTLFTAVAGAPPQRRPLPPPPRQRPGAAAATGVRGVRWSSSSESGPGPAAPGGSSRIWSFEENDDPSSPGGGGGGGVTIIDVREPSEVAETGRIPGSVNVPVASAPDSFHVPGDEFEDRFGFPRPPRDAELLFYCKAGVRSRAAAGVARDAGWARVGEYPGSWSEWFARGGKVER